MLHTERTLGCLTRTPSGQGTSPKFNERYTWWTPQGVFAGALIDGTDKEVVMFCSMAYCRLLHRTLAARFLAARLLEDAPLSGACRRLTRFASCCWLRGYRAPGCCM